MAVEAPPPPQHLTERTVRVIHPSAAPGSGTAGWLPRVVSFRLTSPAAPWLRESVARVQRLTALRPGWDSYEAVPVRASTATMAVQFLLDHAYRELAPPAVVPLSDGGIQLEWHRGGLDLEIAFSEFEPGVYMEDVSNGQSEEASLEEASSYVVRYLARLAG